MSIFSKLTAKDYTWASWLDRLDSRENVSNYEFHDIDHSELTHAKLAGCEVLTSVLRLCAMNRDFQYSQVSVGFFSESINSVGTGVILFHNSPREDMYVGYTTVVTCSLRCYRELASLCEDILIPAVGYAWTVDRELP